MLGHHGFLKWGWAFRERMWILSGIQFTRHFIDFIAVETRQSVGSNVHVILTRQTWGQRSSRVAGSKRRALKNCFSQRILYVFPMSKCRSLRSRSVQFVGTCEKRSAARWWPRKKLCSLAEKIGIWHCAAMETVILVYALLGQNPMFPASKHLFFPEISTAHQFSCASIQEVHRPRSQSPLHFYTGNIWQIRS